MSQLGHRYMRLSCGALPFERLVLDAAAAIGECHVEIPCRLFHARELTNAPAGATRFLPPTAVPDTIPLRSPQDSGRHNAGQRLAGPLL